MLTIFPIVRCTSGNGGKDAGMKLESPSPTVEDVGVNLKEEYKIG